MRVSVHVVYCCQNHPDANCFGYNLLSLKRLSQAGKHDDTLSEASGQNVRPLSSPCSLLCCQKKLKASLCIVLLHQIIKLINAIQLIPDLTLYIDVSVGDSVHSFTPLYKLFCMYTINSSVIHLQLYIVNIWTLTMSVQHVIM